MEVDVKNNYMGDTEMGKHLLNKKVLVFLVLLIFVFIFWFQYKNAIYIVGSKTELYYSNDSIGRYYSPAIMESVKHMEPIQKYCDKSFCYHGVIKYNKLLKTIDLSNVYMEDGYILLALSWVLGRDNLSVQDKVIYGVSSMQWCELYEFLSNMYFYDGYFMMNIQKLPSGAKGKKLPFKIEDKKTLDYINDVIRYGDMLFIGKIVENIKEIWRK